VFSDSNFGKHATVTSKTQFLFFLMLLLHINSYSWMYPWEQALYMIKITYIKSLNNGTSQVLIIYDQISNNCERCLN